jgi:hypothetical protein
MVALRDRLFADDGPDLEFDQAQEERRQREILLTPTPADLEAFTTIAQREAALVDEHERLSEEIATSLEPRQFPVDEPDDDWFRNVSEEQMRHFENPLPEGVLEACRAE